MNSDKMSLPLKLFMTAFVVCLFIAALVIMGLFTWGLVDFFKQKAWMAVVIFSIVLVFFVAMFITPIIKEKSIGSYFKGLLKLLEWI